MKMIKVSVVVPVYNVENYLERCLKSIVNQTLKDIEVIVVNDGSTDNSQNIIDKYVKKYPNKVFGYKKKNGGLSDARNFGIKKCHGDYISFVDSDDYIDKNMLKEMYAKASNGYDIVVCDMVKIWDDGTTQVLKNLSGLLYDYRYFTLSFTMSCNKLYKRELFDDKFKFRVGIFYEDLEFIPSLVLKTNKIAYIPKGFYFYYQREKSIMNQAKFSIKLLDIFEVLNSLEKRFKDALKYDDYKTELEYLNIEHLLYSAGLRFIEFKDAKKYIYKAVDIIKKKFPDWKKNKYYKEKSLKFKFVCRCCYGKHLRVLKILSNLKK